jgi:serine phosphatase RsbU (regulator of sigma subunit)
VTPRDSRIRLAAALLVCCALSLAFAAAALAKHSHSEITGAQSPAGETSGSQAAGSEASAGIAGESGGGEAGAGEAVAGETTHAPASPQTAQDRANAQTTHVKEATKSKRSHETALKGTGASKSGKGSGSSGAGEREAAGTSTSAASQPLAATTGAAAGVPDPHAAATGATSAVVPATPSTHTTNPSRTSPTSTTADRARPHRPPRPASPRRRRTATAGLDSLAPLGLAAADTSPVARAHATHVARAPARTRATGHSRPSPLVTTITKIVDVVPLAVRELIAALFALAVLLGLRSRLAALRARRLERQRTQLLEDVGLLQAALLPEAPERLGPVGTSVAYRPADGPGAGGDFYDVFALPDGQLAIIVGDVSGHGRQALPHTALVRFTLRAYLEAGLSPRDAVQTAGAVLERQLGGAFATVVAATYQPRERVLVYACAGHPPPIVLGLDAAGVLDSAARALAPVTACGSPPIGVGMRTGTRQTVVSIPGRSLVCFHTDGVTEARVGSELFGTERLIDALAELAPHATAPALLARVAERADARPDDMAACVLSVEGRSHASAELAPGDLGEPAPATRAPAALAPVVLVEELELDREDAAAARAERFLLACRVEPGVLTDTARAARTAAARAGSAVLTVTYAGDAPPEVTVQRERLPQLSTRRAKVAVAR